MLEPVLGDCSCPLCGSLVLFDARDSMGANRKRVLNDLPVMWLWRGSSGTLGTACAPVPGRGRRNPIIRPSHNPNIPQRNGSWKLGYFDMPDFGTSSGCEDV